MNKNNGTKKGRSARTYQHKVDRIRKWYAHIVTNRQEVNAEGKAKKELRPLDYFIEKIKGPTKA